MLTPPSEPHAILAHYFCADEVSRTQGALTPQEFAQGLEAYGERLVSADRWIKGALDGSLIDEVCITFDDGLREALTYGKPVCDAFGITAAWNIYTQPLIGVPHSLERWRWVRNHAFGSLEAFYGAWAKLLNATIVAPPQYLAAYGYLSDRDRAFRYWRNEMVSPRAYEHTMGELEALSGQRFDPEGHWLDWPDLGMLENAGHVIGLHGHQHSTTLTKLSVEAQHVDWATSLCIMRQILFLVTTASYPCGQMTDASVAWFKANGISLAWGATMKGSIPWECPRWSTGYWR